MDRLEQSSRVQRAAGGGPVAWGDITGTLTDRADLVAALAAAGGGSSAWSAISVDMGATRTKQYSGSVAALGLIAGDVVDIRLADTDATDENEPDALDLVFIRAQAKADAFDVVMVFSEYQSGPVKLIWRKS